MNDDNNDNRNLLDILENEKFQTIGEYIEFLLSLESNLEKKHFDIQSSKNVLSQLVPNLLDKSVTNLNLAVFILSLHKKDKKIASFYSSLVSKYTSRNISKRGDNHQNVFALVEELLHEANIITHPDNEIDKYFNGSNYSFAVGIKVEEFYKYVPDQSLQDQIQNVMRLRVAFVMTLLQLRTEKYGILKDLYSNDGRYSRELSLAVLFHTLNEYVKDYDKDLLKIYFEVKKGIQADLKQGKLQLPDKRIFKVNSIKRKKVLEHEFKNFFLNEKDFEQNNVLKLISTFLENIEKISDQIFPVVAVRDPITGRIIRIDLTKYGSQANVMEEVDIPKLNILQEDVEEYIRKELAKMISDYPDKSLEEIVATVLKTKNLDSETTVKAIVYSIRSNVYSPLGWNRKLLFWLNNFDNEKTVVGNLISQLISVSLLPSSLKIKLEMYTNIKGSTLFVAVFSLALGGLPLALALTSLTIALNKIIKKEKNEITFSKSYLNGVFGYTKKDLDILSINGQNSYLQLLKFIMEKNDGALKDYKNVFKSADFDLYNGSIESPLQNLPLIGFLFRNKYLKYVPATNILGANTARKVQFGFNSIFGFLGLIGLKIGIAPNSLQQSLRKSKENIEIIRNLSRSKENTDKKNEAFTVLNMFTKNSLMFGYTSGIFASMMLKELTQSLPKNKIFNKLGIFFAPNFQKTSGESFLYSWSGRTLQKTLFAIGDNLNLFARRRGVSIIDNIMTGIGNTSNNVIQSVNNLNNGITLKKATAGLAFLMGGVSILAFISMQSAAPLLIANRAAFGAVGGGESTTDTSNLPCLNGDCTPTTAGSNIGCPLEGPIQCSQPSNGPYSHYDLIIKYGQKALDLSYGPGDPRNVVYAESTGVVSKGDVACDGNREVILKGTDGKTYVHLHMWIAYEGPVEIGKPIGILYPNGSNCSQAEHLHFLMKDSNEPRNGRPSDKWLNPLQYIKDGKLNCNIKKASSANFCAGPYTPYNGSGENEYTGP